MVLGTVKQKLEAMEISSYVPGVSLETQTIPKNLKLGTYNIHNWKVIQRKNSKSWRIRIIWHPQHKSLTS